MKLKQAAHEAVQSKRKRLIHEVAIQGDVFVNGTGRKGWMVTQTYRAKNGDVFQGVGVSYFNPSDPAYDPKLGYDLARGRAELSLGAQLLEYNEEFGWDKSLTNRIRRIVLDAVHRLPKDRRWKTTRSRKQHKSTSSTLQIPVTASPSAPIDVLVPNQAVSVTQYLGSTCSINNTLNVQSAEPQLTA